LERNLSTTEMENTSNPSPPLHIITYHHDSSTIRQNIRLFPFFNPLD
jgi:hypothetical protein